MAQLRLLFYRNAPLLGVERAGAFVAIHTIGRILTARRVAPLSAARGQIYRRYGIHPSVSPRRSTAARPAHEKF